MKPKKLILSRKGFDSGSGGSPSPIFPYGTMFSLPIPSRDREQLDGLQHGDVDIASVVAGITGGRINGRDRVHLDPDLNFDTYRHRKHRAAWQQWRGTLGQTGIAQGHLWCVSFFRGVMLLRFSSIERVVDTQGGWTSARVLHFEMSRPVLHTLSLKSPKAVPVVVPDLATCSAFST